LIDIHAHLQFPQFDGDRDEVIKRTEEAGIGVINVGTDIKTSEAAVKLAEKHNKMWATVGLHPSDWQIGFEYNFYKKLATHPKVVAIGECGLDYFRVRGEDEKVGQREIFGQQIQLALEVKKPLMIHCRDAYADVVAVLKSFSGVIGNVHFFTSDWLTAKKFLDLGFSLSFSGVITFVRDYDEVVRNVPLEMIFVETDCPFAAPVPYRGQRNEPRYLVEVLRQVATLRGVAEETVGAAVLNNVRRLFQLPLA